MLLTQRGIHTFSSLVGNVFVHSFSISRSYQINAAAALPFNPTAKMRFGILKIGVLLKGGGAGLSHGTGV